MLDYTTTRYITSGFYLRLNSVCSEHHHGTNLVAFGPQLLLILAVWSSYPRSLQKKTFISDLLINVLIGQKQALEKNPYFSRAVLSCLQAVHKVPKENNLCFILLSYSSINIRLMEKL